MARTIPAALQCLYGSIRRRCDGGWAGKSKARARASAGCRLPPWPALVKPAPGCWPHVGPWRCGFRGLPEAVPSSGYCALGGMVSEMQDRRRGELPRMRVCGLRNRACNSDYACGRHKASLCSCSYAVCLRFSHKYARAFSRNDEHTAQQATVLSRVAGQNSIT